MTALVGLSLLLVIGGTGVLLLAWGRWVKTPALPDETIEALWAAVGTLHESVQRLEQLAVRLDDLSRGEPAVCAVRKGVDVR